MAALAAVAIEGARGVGKTATAMRRAGSVYSLDDEAHLATVRGDHSVLLRAPAPVFIDEWQRYPPVWDLVRRAVDNGAPPGRFLLAGSAAPLDPPAHPGAGRIVRVQMRPMVMSERLPTEPAVSLAQLMEGERPPIEGDTEMTLAHYADEIAASGFPALRALPLRVRERQLDSYIASLMERDFDEVGHRVRAPRTLGRWLAAYAAATSTTATFETIRGMAAGDDGEVPSRATTLPYREALARLHMTEPVDAWLPTRSPIKRLTFPPKHQLVDPALAARLLTVEAADLLRPDTAGGLREGPLVGALFESLATQSVRVYAQRAGAGVGHLRTKGGAHEVDLIVERGRRVVAIEVKMAAVPTDRDVRHLVWLKEQLGDDLRDAIVITTGRHAYRRADGIGVVPLALLGP